MFGFKIIPDRKKDKYDLKMFEKTVRSIDNLTYNMLVLVSQRSPTIVELNDFVEKLQIFVYMYNQNKFSSPSSGFSIEQTIIDMSKHVNTHINITKQLLHKTTVDMEHRKALSTEAISIINNIYQIRHIIKFDVIRLDLGFDIIMDYYYNKKNNQIHKQACDNTMTIRFIKPSKVDINYYKKKEVNKK